MQVYVSEDGGIERASEAVRRGRMIKCKLCGEKGATLGCHKRSCRASFHLPCAREHGCLLQVKLCSLFGRKQLGMLKDFLLLHAKSSYMPALVVIQHACYKNLSCLLVATTHWEDWLRILLVCWWC